MNTTQEVPTQAGQTLSERLKQAYEDVSPNQRVLARRDFCQFHGVTDDTFRAKRTGQRGYTVTLGECIWMENYKPIINP